MGCTLYKTRRRSIDSASIPIVLDHTINRWELYTRSLTTVPPEGHDSASNMSVVYLTCPLTFPGRPFNVCWKLLEVILVFEDQYLSQILDSWLDDRMKELTDSSKISTNTKRKKSAHEPDLHRVVIWVPQNDLPEVPCLAFRRWNTALALAKPEQLILAGLCRFSVRSEIVVDSPGLPHLRRILSSSFVPSSRLFLRLAAECIAQDASKWSEYSLQAKCAGGGLLLLDRVGSGLSGLVLAIKGELRMQNPSLPNSRNTFEMTISFSNITGTTKFRYIAQNSKYEKRSGGVIFTTCHKRPGGVIFTTCHKRPGGVIYDTIFPTCYKRSGGVIFTTCHKKAGGVISDDTIQDFSNYFI
ncbi:hypothetical protein ACFE04_019897 [Oxalis oulophora]